MKYRQLAPPPSLKHYIRYFWVLENTEADTYTFKTLADGGPGILFQSRTQGIYHQHSKLLPELLLYGQSTVAADMHMNGTFNTLGILFYPNALKSVFGLDADNLTDLCLDLNDLAKEDGYYLLEELSACLFAEDKIAVLSSYLTFMVKKNSPLANTVMDYAVSEIFQSKGSLSLKALQEKTGFSERSMERKFKQHTGLSPRLFARICQFQNSLDQLWINNFEKLGDIAYDNAYADQSHLIRSFQQFAGASPKQIRKKANTLFSSPDFDAKDPIAGFVLFYGLERV